MRNRVVRPRVLPCFAWGLGAATGRGTVVLALWAFQAVIGLAVTLPVFAWLSDVTSPTPAAAPLLDRFSLDLYTELRHYGNASALRLGRASAAGGLLLGVLSAPLLLGAVLASLSAPGIRVVDAAASAFRGYWPALRLFLFGRVAAALLGGAVAAAFAPLVELAGNGASEAAALATVGLQIAAAALIVAAGFAAVDYGLLELTRAGSRRAFASWLRGVRYVWRRPVSSVGLWVTAGLGLGIAAAVYLGFRESVPSNTAPLILLMIVVQQAFIAVRVMLRVALLAAEKHALDQAHPLDDVVTAAAPPTPTAVLGTAENPLASGVQVPAPEEAAATPVSATGER